jgi:putative tricarboxylic transport membrane protein
MTLSKDLRAGLFLIACGAVVIWLVRDYPSGTLSDIGSGAMLQLAGASILLLGAIMALRGWRHQAASADDSRVSPRAFIVPGAMAVFALLLPWCGLAVTAIISTLIAGFGSRELSWKERVLCSVLLGAFVTLLFGYALRLQVPIWPWSI